VGGVNGRRRGGGGALPNIMESEGCKYLTAVIQESVLVFSGVVCLLSAG
jgi:hypothetical protein